jgi:hypothetical protein
VKPVIEWAPPSEEELRARGVGVKPTAKPTPKKPAKKAEE